MRSTFTVSAWPAAAFLLSTMFPPCAFAGSLPWIAEPGTGSIDLSYVRQNASKFWAGTRKGPHARRRSGPHAKHRLGDRGLRPARRRGGGCAARLGRSSEFGDAPELDRQIGLQRRRDMARRRRVDPRLAQRCLARAGVIVAGDYELGHINSIGDGGDGFEASVIVGKYFNRFGLALEYGVRSRNNDIPTNTFANLTALLSVSEPLTLRPRVQAR